MNGIIPGDKIISLRVIIQSSRSHVYLLNNRQVIKDEDEMLRLGKAIAGYIPAGSIIYLHGDLGAGKTTITKGIIAGLGCSDHVTSPTYTLVERYCVEGTTIYHFDLYRLKSPDELESIGVRDMLDGDAISIFEWPERGMGVLPDADFDIYLDITETGRVVDVPKSLTADLSIDLNKAEG